MTLRRLLAVFVVAVSILAASALVPVGTASAQTQTTPSEANCAETFLGLPTWYRYLELDEECEIVGPRSNGEFDWARALGYVGVAVIEILLRLASVIAVIYVMYGGFRFITSQGEPDNAKAARETILNALIGLVITIAAATIIGFIARRLTS